jgi:tetratricopeptide (TPR) repeat protein
MAHKLMPYKVGNGMEVPVDVEITKKCLFEPPSTPSKTPQYGFLFRSLNDKDLFFDQTQSRMIEMYRTIFVWLANTYAADSTKNDLTKSVLSRMEEVVPNSHFKMDYRQSYQVAMLYNLLGEKKKFDEYAKIAEEGAMIDKRSSNQNTSSFYNPYRILLDLYEARGDYQKALNLLNELDQRDPSVNQKRESLKLKMSGGVDKKGSQNTNKDDEKVRIEP